MRSPFNAPVFATVFAIGLGFAAQATNSEDAYQGPFLKLWNAAFHSQTIEQPAGNAPFQSTKGYWL